MNEPQFIERKTENRHRKREWEAVRESDAALATSINLGVHLTVWPCLAIGFCFLRTHSLFTVENAMQLMLMVAVAAIIVGSSIGWLSHRLFWQRIRWPVAYLTVAMTLIFDLTMFGWMVISSDSHGF